MCTYIVVESDTTFKMNISVYFSRCFSMKQFCFLCRFVNKFKLLLIFNNPRHTTLGGMCIYFFHRLYFVYDCNLPAAKRSLVWCNISPWKWNLRLQRAKHVTCWRQSWKYRSAEEEFVVMVTYVMEDLFAHPRHVFSLALTLELGTSVLEPNLKTR